MPHAGDDGRGGLRQLRRDEPRHHSKAQLAALLGGRLPFGPVNDARDIFSDPHVAVRGMIADVPHAEPGKPGWRVAANPIRFSATSAVPPSAPPRLGEHNQAFAAEAHAKSTS